MHPVNRSLFCTLLALGVQALVAGDSEPSGAPGPSASVIETAFEQGGLRVGVALSQSLPPSAALAAGGSLLAASEVSIELAIGDAGSGAPLRGAFPMAWLVAESSAEALDAPDSCERAVRGLLLGRMARRAAVSLNEYRVVTLDDNNSISIIDPQLDSSKTKLVGMVPLPARPTDLALGADQSTVFAALASGKVARADLSARRARYLELGGSPARLDVQPGGQLLWVGDASGTDAHVLDTQSWSERARLELGAGPHAFAFDGARRVFATARGARRLLVIDGQSLEVRARVALGSTPTEPVWSESARQVYVGDADGVVRGVGGDSPRASETRLGEAITSLGASPDGRWLFALHAAADAVSVLDAATGSLRAELHVPGRPTRVDFSASFAYIRRAESEQYSLVELASLAAGGAPNVADVLVAQSAPGISARHDRSFVSLPEGGGALLLSAIDRSIYHFAEGMSAPMGSYPLYPWTAHGILLADRSLREASPGLYRTRFTAPEAGRYRLIVLLPSSPRLYDCSIPVSVERGASAERAPRLRLAGPSLSSPPRAGAPSTLEIELKDAESGAPAADIGDLVALVFQLPSWQERRVARPLGAGRYAIEVNFPRAGQYMLMLESESRGLHFNDLPGVRVSAGAPPAAELAGRESPAPAPRSEDERMR